MIAVGRKRFEFMPKTKNSGGDEVKLELDDIFEDMESYPGPMIKQYIRKTIEAEKAKLLQRVEDEVIGKDEGVSISQGIEWREEWAEFSNRLKERQRQALEKLKGED